MADSGMLERLLALDPAVRLSVVSRMPATEREYFLYKWDLWARTEQLPPPGDWRVWLIMAGRGFGKTRAGAEWVRMVARSRPDARIALVAASLPEARSVMVEGESGVLAVSPGAHRPAFEPSKRVLTWSNGAQAFLYSAGEPESLRGPQHSHARRAGAKGIPAQRRPYPDRRAAPPGGGGRGERAACRARSRRMLAGRPYALGRVGRSSRQACLLERGHMDLRHPARRDAPARPFDRAGPAP